MVEKRARSIGGAMADVEEEYNIKWNNHSHEALYVVNQLRSYEAFADVLLFCEGTCFKANRMILAACSGYFQQIFIEMQSQTGFKSQAVVAMRETRPDLLQLALDFMYQGEVLVPSASLQDFMDFAEDMQIRGLRRDPGLPNATQNSVERNNNMNTSSLPATTTTTTTTTRTTNGPTAVVPQAKKIRTQEQASTANAAIIANETQKEDMSEEEFEDESFMNMKDEFMPEAEFKHDTTTAPAFVPPDISTEDPVMRVTEVTWRGIHKETRSQWHFCGICGYNTRYQAALMRHERMHTGEKPFQCLFCDRRFTTKYWQQYHQRNTHVGELTSLEFKESSAANTECYPALV